MGVVDPLVAYSRDSLVIGVIEDPNTLIGVLRQVGINNLGGVIGGAVNHDEQFKIRVGLR